MALRAWLGAPRSGGPSNRNIGPRSRLVDRSLIDAGKALMMSLGPLSQACRRLLAGTGKFCAHQRALFGKAAKSHGEHWCLRIHHRASLFIEMR